MIRLQRRGRKNDPSFRVIVVDSKRAAKSGKYLEMVGSYDPRVDRIDLKPERITHWLDHGAQASDTVHNLLVSQKIIDAKKINVLPRKTVAMKDAEPTPNNAETAPVAQIEEVSTEAEVTAPASEETAAEPEAEKS